MNPLNFYAVGLIKIYQAITKNMEHRCPHYPSCSEYAKLAYEKYGFLKATRLAAYRLNNCDIGRGDDIPYEHWP